MEKATSIVAVCENTEQVNQAVEYLKHGGLDMQTFSMTAKDTYDSNRGPGYYHTGDQTFTIPGIGHMLVAGPLAAWITAAFDGAVVVGDTGIVGKALATIGISHRSIINYETELRAGKHLILVHGSPRDIVIAKSLIGGTAHCFHTVHGENIYSTVPGETLPALLTSTYQG